MQNFYSLLGISESASQAEIKVAFKKLAVQYHPDKHAGNEDMADKFKEINLAYQTLSNPYEKARYDIKLTYSRSTSYTSTVNTPPQPAWQPPSRPYHRPQYAEPKINWRENWIATAYAFGFTLVVATVVMTAIFIKNFYDDKRYEERLVERRALFESARENYKLGHITDALTALSELTPYLKEEKDMVEFKTDLFQSFIAQGQESYINKQFDDAIYYYELIERFSPQKPIAMKEQLAKAYQNTNQPYQAIKIWKELMVMGIRNLDTYLTLARIYRDQIKDNQEALRYFTLGDEWAVKQYRAIYGDAFPLVLSGEHLPPQHYELYLSLAHIYLDLDMYEKAVKTTKWNIQVWPDSVDNYIIAAEGFLALEQTQESCDKFAEASALGYRNTIPSICYQ